LNTTIIFSLKTIHFGEISEIYKENPGFFKLLAAKLVEALPEKFSLKLIQKIFDKDSFMLSVEEKKVKNMTVDQYNKEKRKNDKLEMRQKELEEKKKREELENLRKQQGNKVLDE